MVKAKKSSMSFRQYARRRGVSPEAVSKAVKTGRIHADKYGQIDPEQADLDWEANTDQSRNPARNNAPSKSNESDATPASGIPPYSQSRSIREAYEARITKLDYEVKSGKLINADEVRVIAFNASRMARDKMMGLPDRVSSLLAGISDGHEINRLLTAEIRLMCEELSKDAQPG